jgi:hypothetical protein
MPPHVQKSMIAIKKSFILNHSMSVSTKMNNSDVSGKFITKRKALLLVKFIPVSYYPTHMQLGLLISEF